MRYVSINLSSDNYLEQPQIFGGYAGEHNETILQVTLPQRMIGAEYSGYRFDFQTSEDNEIPSPLIPISELNNGALSFHLTEQLTIAGKLLFNVVATLVNGDVVSLTSKTNMVALYIGDSPDGNSILPDPNGYKDEILKMIDDRISEALEGIQVGEGGTIVVDQTYTPESPNAQSGIAVEQALNQYPYTPQFMGGVMGLVQANGYTTTEQVEHMFNVLSQVQINENKTSKLETNKVYRFDVSGGISFQLPTADEIDNTILNTIELQLNISNYDGLSMDLGATKCFGDIPELNNGSFIIYYEYDGTNWCVGALEIVGA